VDLFDLIRESKAMVEELEAVFVKSTLPELVDPELINTILIDIRRKFYLNTL
jgi:hypothetical protein